jgi:hypothetical protein
MSAVFKKYLRKVVMKQGEGVKSGQGNPIKKRNKMDGAEAGI